MKRSLVLACAALAFAAAPAAGIAAVPPANGDDVVLPDGSVYQLGDDGAYHLIPDVATANAMQLDWNGLAQVGSLDGPVGDPIPSVAAAAAPQVVASTRTATVSVPPANGDDVVLPDGSVYQLGDDGAYHLIPDVATANAMHLDWNGLAQVGSLDGPVGDPIPSVD